MSVPVSIYSVTLINKTIKTNALAATFAMKQDRRCDEYRNMTQFMRYCYYLKHVIFTYHILQCETNARETVT